MDGKMKEQKNAVELFLVKSVTLVVSDSAGKSEQPHCDKRKWDYASGGSGGPPSLRSIEIKTPTLTPPTPSLNGECPLSNSTNTRGQTAHRTKSRVDAMLERALTQPQKCSVDPLDNAQSWGIPIWTIGSFQIWLDKIYTSLRENSNLKCIRRNNSIEKDIKVKEFDKSYIKFESFKRETRPVFLELPVWPTLNFEGDPGSCPFDKKKCYIKPEKKDKSDSKKDMTRRSRALATRARRSEQLVVGYCEICRIDYGDLSKHIQSDKHLAFVRNDDNFLSLDTLINSGASVEAFLKLNQTDDVGQDLFHNGTDKLHGVVIRNSKSDKTVKSDINDYHIDELKMVQCNGARRKLNLKLSSPHNLRARTKHESGHLLRSKGSPRHEVEKSDKFYDKFDGFTIKKRAKGTIWLEEDDPPENKPCVEDEVDAKSAIVEEKSPLSELNDGTSIKGKDRSQSEKKSQLSKVEERKDKKYPSENGRDEPALDSLVSKVVNGDSRLDAEPAEKSPGKAVLVNGSSKSPALNATDRLNPVEAKPNKDTIEEIEIKVLDCAPLKSPEKPQRSARISESEKQEEKCKPKFPKRAMRSMRTRQRLSVEERLIEDNRAYYKVEVLGNKLRSSTAHWNNASSVATLKDPKELENQRELEDAVKKDDEPSSEKPVVVRFKRVRKSELSLLSDEAESFMFGDSRRDDSTDASENGDDNGSSSSVLPVDTESDCERRTSSIIMSSPTASPVKQEPMDDDSQDSMYMGRARKRRRTQAEALIKDNTDYYKFEIPGSRLRFQGSPTATGEDLSSSIVKIFQDDEPPKVSSPQIERETDNGKKNEDKSDNNENCEKLYPSKPSAEVEKMKFSFESVPKSEPWYQTYQRQDEGAEFWHFSSESDWKKPFLLPYEMENFHENLLKLYQKNDARKRVRAIKASCLGKSPRKSPRCHASTLAIMSTIIRKREQQSHSSSTSVADEESCSRTTTPKPDKPDKSEKSSTDLEIHKIVKSIDDMLNADAGVVDDSFELDTMETIIENEPPEPEKDFKSPSSCPLRIPGAPDNLLDLLENCHQHMAGIDNSSCASSECGELLIESPLKRRKRRKNRTGWPGRIRRRLQVKPIITQDVDSERENLPAPSHRHQSTAGEEEEEEEEEDEEEEDDEEFAQERDKLVKCDRTKASSDFDECIPSKCEQEKASNDENHENVFRNDNKSSPTKQHIVSKSTTRRRRDTVRESGRPSSSEAMDSHFENENDDSGFRRKGQSTIISRKNYTAGTLANKRRQPEADDRESKTTDITEGETNSVGSQSDAECMKKECANSTKSIKKSTMKTRTRQHKGSSGDSTFDKEPCKKESLDPEIDSPLSERITPVPQPTGEMQQRRASIEFQPVVRVRKIDDQVDMDHSILSVTVASNRRLRSSTSPRSRNSPPAKRYKRSRGPFGRWMKES
ncbi:uncharacterized protein LOC135161788 isoform X2 [Diachasmimorpha longicaudata]|uniref:uncharacterized protein LOC135161788 isoform X2 n=1 Tax=Diachasmimorpha longicaudata TaxID=58733 RepID=UPI0030B90167